MIESIQFTNFKALRNATLPLAPFTLLVGPNGSGKSSVLQALQQIAGLAVEAAGLGGNLQNLRARTDDPRCRGKIRWLRIADPQSDRHEDCILECGESDN